MNRDRSRRGGGLFLLAALVTVGLVGCAETSSHPGDPPTERDAAAEEALQGLAARVAAGDPVVPGGPGGANVSGCLSQFNDVHLLEVPGFGETTVSTTIGEPLENADGAISTETRMPDGRTVCALPLDFVPDGTLYRDRLPAVLLAVVGDSGRDLELRCVADCEEPLFETNSPTWTWDGAYLVVPLPTGLPGA